MLFLAEMNIVVGCWLSVVSFLFMVERTSSEIKSFLLITIKSMIFISYGCQLEWEFRLISIFLVAET